MIKKFLFKNILFKFNKINAKINLKPRELNLLSTNKCLCLCPHADDESIGMGGVISMFANCFDIILLTDGRKGVDLKPEKAIELREKEFQCAMKVAKVENYKFLKAQDKKLLDSFELFNTIDFSKYDYIFVPNIIDQHPDHKAVSMLLSETIKNNTKIKKDLKICFYEVWSTLGMVNAFVDISDYAEIKKEMINCYKSQTEKKDYVYHALGLNQYRGMFKDKKFVEAFCMMSVDEFQKICELY